MKIQTIIAVLLCWVILSGCLEEVGAELDTNVYLTNQSAHNLRFFASLHYVDSSEDTVVQEVVLNGIYDNISQYEVIDSQDTAYIFRHNLESLERGTNLPIVYFIFNTDTLNSLSKEEVLATERGVTKYFYRSIDDYEATHFTLVYPKE